MSKPQMSPIKHIAISLLVLAAVLLTFEFTNLDLWVQSLFYNSQTQSWVLDTSHPILHFMLYDGPKKLLVIFEVSLLIAAVCFHKRALIKSYQQGILIVLIALPLGPSLVSSLKSTTNVSCPYALTQYGGDLPYIGVFEHYPSDQQPDKRQRCFPAGHASGGFALLALVYLMKTLRRKRQILMLAITAGALMGGYKMAVGHHFLSHTLVSMILCWFVVNLVALLVLPWPDKHRHAVDDFLPEAACAKPE
ncbi:MAG: membrane-associated PAP2 superfamily phosphatase [Neolewinella sp.]|jgi:membrane-associated PAP2 superfamily phosphatase